MQRQVALIRGINVGRAKRVAMAELRAMVPHLRYSDVRTLSNSGNLVDTVAIGRPRRRPSADEPPGSGAPGGILEGEPARAGDRLLGASATTRNGSTRTRLHGMVTAPG
ncbi:DUF1697 domain-containing protein [Planctomyces sp. SH-PL62]|uniref:DUF1697 domain-containing protein n=1 Tax=Planctomyces sp. SH-PL62 TaxID=1636152 RepID=UPI00078E7362|nr:DUF1697 domain-containing protein [Planctomyces sp. SH-PL62]AMV40773.1 hypothetical protein VT85_25295 [Planctomyces sp. SH-PL62]